MRAYQASVSEFLDTIPIYILGGLFKRNILGIVFVLIAVRTHAARKETSTRSGTRRGDGIGHSPVGGLPTWLVSDEADEPNHRRRESVPGHGGTIPITVTNETAEHRLDDLAVNAHSSNTARLKPDRNDDNDNFGDMNV